MSAADESAVEHPVGKITTVEISTLCRSESPRLAGIDERHAALLADSPTALPPILVARGSMRVIDGMHRLRAAQLNRRTTIDVRFVEADEYSSFLAAVAENIRHGLPLTLADRRAAARRILEKSPEWSDRAIARAVGLSGKTIATVRREKGADFERSRRKGLDGRERSVGQQRVIGRATQRVSARQPAARSSSSSSTQNTRRRFADDSPAITEHQPLNLRTSEPPPSRKTTVLNVLRSDPSLRYSNAGRTLVSWLAGSALNNDSAEDVVEALPSHCLPLVIDLIHSHASFWSRLAELAKRRAEREKAS